MATLLIWSDFCGPLATGLTELVVFKIFVPHRDGNEFELLFFTAHLGVNYVIYKKPHNSIIWRLVIPYP